MGLVGLGRLRIWMKMGVLGYEEWVMLMNVNMYKVEGGNVVITLIDESYGYVGWKSKGGHAHGTSCNLDKWDWIELTNWPYCSIVSVIASSSLADTVSFSVDGAYVIASNRSMLDVETVPIKIIECMSVISRRSFSLLPASNKQTVSSSFWNFNRTCISVCSMHPCLIILMLVIRRWLHHWIHFLPAKSSTPIIFHISFSYRNS